jgi:DNA polymerase-3 subunit gamma/tau
MASQSLYRKWRSQTFGDLVGQETVIQTLRNALNSGKLAHAYLFTGPRGTGKTSMARLLAKTINCLNPQDGEPCNVCEQCREITAGSSFNVMEIDAASNRGIDSIRELREKVMVPPSTGRYKVYILDEAHMLTTEAFNALLKTLEEPPPHAIFVMATTDVHKMLPTVLSRCQRFDFKRFSTLQLVAHLRYVAGQEQVTLESGAAELIARAAAGGMRDALSLLDQAIAYSGSVISLAQVQSMLGVADPRAIQKFVSHIASSDSPAGLHLINELAEAGADLRQINAQVAEYFRAMMLARAGAAISEILDLTEDEMREVSEVSRRFALEELTECARIFAQNELVQKNQGTPQLGLELAFLACIELHARAQSGQPLSPSSSSSVAALPSTAPARPVPIQERPRNMAPAAGPATPAVAQEYPSPRAVQERPLPPVETRPVALQVSQVPVPENEGPLPDWDDMPYEDEVEAAPSPLREVAPAPLKPLQQDGYANLSARETSSSLVSVQVEEVADSSALTLQDVKEKWELIKRRVKSKKDGAKIAAFLNGFIVAGVEGAVVPPLVIIRANMEFHYKSLQNEAHHAAIEWAMKMELQQECKLRLLPPSAGGIGAVLPPPPSNGGGAAINNRVQAPTRQSAHLERPADVSPRAPERVASSPPAQRQQPARSTPPNQPDRGAPVPAAEPPPLARNAVVRENTERVTPGKGETRLGMVEKKAKSDQVIQEAIRMFKAEVKDIHLK